MDHQGETFSNLGVETSEGWDGVGGCVLDNFMRLYNKPIDFSRFPESVDIC